MCPADGRERMAVLVAWPGGGRVGFQKLCNFSQFANRLPGTFALKVGNLEVGVEMQIDAAHLGDGVGNQIGTELVLFGKAVKLKGQRLGQSADLDDDAVNLGAQLFF